MKIAIPSTKPNLEGNVESKLGTAAFLLLIETDDMSFEVLDGPPKSSGRGAGVMALSQVLNMGAKVVLVGHISPRIFEVMEKQDIDVVTSVSGIVNDVVADYVKSQSTQASKQPSGPPIENSSAGSKWIEALNKGLRQFHSFLPRLVGVILLLGLFRGFVSEEALLTLFSQSTLYDSLWGASLGSILAGNPVNSYVIAKSLLTAGVGLAGVTALMLAWVNVGLIQLPAEAAALGLRFALVRNIAGFVMAVIMSFVVVLLQGWIA